MINVRSNLDPTSEPRSDAGKPKDPQRRLGQVFTPDDIAAYMVQMLASQRPVSPIRILDAGSGPGTFAKGFIQQEVLTSKDEIICIDIDPNLIAQCAQLK